MLTEHAERLDTVTELASSVPAPQSQPANKETNSSVMISKAVDDSVTPKAVARVALGFIDRTRSVRSRSVAESSGPDLHRVFSKLTLERFKAGDRSE